MDVKPDKQSLCAVYLGGVRTLYKTKYREVQISSVLRHSLRAPDAVTGTPSQRGGFLPAAHPCGVSSERENVSMEDPFDDLDELVAARMIAILQEHGWDFTYGRDPVLILIEFEEPDEDQE